MKSIAARRSRIASIWALLAVVIALLAQVPAQAAPQKNWVGPGCPPRGWNCQGTATGTEGDPVEQTASGRGSINHANCTGPCYVQQTATGGARNEADCRQNANVPGPSGTTNQVCVVTQSSDTGSNTINVRQTAQLGPVDSDGDDDDDDDGDGDDDDGDDDDGDGDGRPVGSASVVQDSSQLLDTNQTSTSGANTLKSTQSISQNALTRLEVPVSHEQETLQLADVEQNNNTGLNSATVAMKRDQSSSATGAPVEQLQDVQPNGGGFPDPDGRVQLHQENGAGRNTANLSGTDTKSQNARTLNDSAEQHQGHFGGGWQAVVEMNDDDGPNPSNLTMNFKKPWTQRARAQDGQQPDDHDHSQIDGILENLIGRSPDNVRSTGESDIKGDPGVRQECYLEANGFADEGWTGSLSCVLDDGQSEERRRESWRNEQFVNAFVACVNNPPSEEAFLLEEFEQCSSDVDTTPPDSEIPTA